MLTALIGFFSGVLSGMGVGGGMLLIPALRIFFNMGQQAAQSVNLFCFIPASVCALFIHLKKKNVDFKAALPMIITGVPFSLLGAFICIHISPKLLGKFFGAFILIFGIREIFSGFNELKSKKPTKHPKKTN